VGFVPEAGKQNRKTPDLWADKNGKRILIEANAKQPVRTIDSPEREWQLIRDILEEKKQKFSEAIYAPGLIVADVSPITHRINKPGIGLRLRRIATEKRFAEDQRRSAEARWEARVLNIQ
jgi:hypothetical protein